MNKSKVFVLTLSGDDARRAPLLYALEQQGIEYELFFGVDGRQGLSSKHETMIDRAATNRAMRRPLTDGEYACTLSHRAIYERMLAEDLDAVLVLEDDAMISARLGEFLRLGGLYAAPMILLDYSRVSVSRIPAKWFQDLGRLRRVIVSPSLTTGYVVSAAAARVLLQWTTPVCSTADWPGDLYELKAFALSPRLVDHLPDGNALSHLATRRAPEMLQKRKKPFLRHFTPAYWRTYLRRRLSVRLDP